MPVNSFDNYPMSWRPLKSEMKKPYYLAIAACLEKDILEGNLPENTKLFEYSSPFGTSRQLNSALKWLHHLGIDTAKDNIFVSAGAQNALSVVLISLFEAGDKIAVDNFTYTNFKGLANLLHIQLIPIDVDDSGICPDSLTRVCENAKIKGIYLMPTCSNPTSIFMSKTRRQEIAEVIRKYHLRLIEDDIYSFLVPHDVKTLYSLVPEHTIHICSISKSLCAGLRVAFLVFPLKHKEALTAGMLNINLKTVSLNGEIIAELIESGIASDIARQKISLAIKRNQIFQSVFNISPSDNIPRFFRWLLLPAHLTSEQVEVLALQRGVHILGSHRFAIQCEQKSAYIRISIVSPDSEEDLMKGLLVLKNIFEERIIHFFV